MGRWCYLDKGVVFVGQLPIKRFEIIFSEMSYPMLTSLCLRKRWRQSIRECLYVVSSSKMEILFTQDFDKKRGKLWWHNIMNVPKQHKEPYLYSCRHPHCLQSEGFEYILEPLLWHHLFDPTISSKQCDW